MSAIKVYLKELLSDLDMDEITKQELYDEFYNHLTLSKLNYMEQGIIEEEAERRCIQEFGHSKAIGRDIQKSMFPKRHLINRISWILFVPYIITILYRLFIGGLIKFPNGSWETTRFYFYNYAVSHGVSEQIPSYNFIPLKTIYTYLINFDFQFIVENIVLFLPLGIFLYILFPFLRIRRNFIISVSLFLVGIELIQFLTHLGTADIDVVILRLIGVFIGVFLFEKGRTMQISFGKKIKDLI